MARYDPPRRRGRSFDPLRRARDFPNMPSPRKEVLAMERRFRKIETLADLALSIALQQPGASPVEVLNALPDPTNLDLGRQIVVRLPGETVSTIYMGLLGADDVVFWQRLAQGTSIVGSSPEYTFLGHSPGFGAGILLEGIHWDEVSGTARVQVCCGSTADIRRWNITTGVVSIFRTGLKGYDITVDGSSDEYVAEKHNGRVSKQITNPNGSAGQFFTVTGKNYRSIAHYPGTSNLYTVADTENQLLKLNMSTLAVEATVSGLSNPQGVCVGSDGTIYTTNLGTHKIRKYNSAMTFVSEIGSPGSGPGQFQSPRGIDVDDQGRIYVADSGNNRVQVLDANGNYVGHFGSFGTGNGQFSTPVGICVRNNLILVADQSNIRISQWLRAS